MNLESEIRVIEQTKSIGAMELKTDRLIKGLIDKCREWKNNYAYNLHDKAKSRL